MKMKHKKIYQTCMKISNEHRGVDFFLLKVISRVLIPYQTTSIITANELESYGFRISCECFFIQMNLYMYYVTYCKKIDDVATHGHSTSP
jgi:hypothetical protein